MEIRLHRFLPKTAVEGPGTRCCIWVQGCLLHCPGCGAEQTWDTEGGQGYEADDLFQLIKNIEGIEGVTFLGGEPFLQAEGLYYLGKKIQDLGLSVLTFTGYTYEEIIETNDCHWNNLISVTDILIDGPFVISKFDLSRPWVGSSNQKYRFLTVRYQHLQEQLLKIKNKMEVQIHSNGSIQISGMGNFERIKKEIMNLGEGYDND